MDKVNKALIELLSVSTGCQMSSAVELDAEEWRQLYDEAVAHQIQSLIFSEAYKYGVNINPELFSKWKNSVIVQLIKYNERFSIVGELLNALFNANIPVIVLKGLHYKYLYIDPTMRTMGDIDVLVTKQSLNIAIDVIKSFGYIQIKEDDPKHIQLAHKNYVPIELHFSLFTEAKRKIAVNFNKEIWESSYYFENDGLKFLVPSQGNQLLYCCIHMTNHFGMGGFGLRQLSDFNLLAKSVSQTFDWDELIEKAGLYGVGKFMEVILVICNRMFGLSVQEKIINKYSIEYDNVESMIQMILDAGVFGEKDNKSLQNRIIASYISPNGKNGVSKLNYIFPSIEQLSPSYSYAHKYKILLPIAWVHRLFRNVFNIDIDYLKAADPKIVDNYVKLFRWIDIKRN